MLQIPLTASSKGVLRRFSSANFAPVIRAVDKKKIAVMSQTVNHGSCPLPIIEIVYPFDEPLLFHLDKREESESQRISCYVGPKQALNYRSVLTILYYVLLLARKVVGDLL